MNLHGVGYFAYQRLRGSAIPRYYREILEADARGVGPDDARERLARLLWHCREHVPYYRARLRGLPDPARDPEAALARLPILTKDVVRAQGAALRSDDLARRRWFEKTSGGSTGEPVRLIQDADHLARTEALALAYSRWIGHEVGEPAVLLWGSERDVLEGTVGLRSRVANAVKRTTFLNAFRMTPEAMRGFARTLRRTRPRLVLAYAQAAYELAGFLEAEGLAVPPPRAVITSAGTLHDFMRERIARVFGCPVFDRYGSREVGLIAAERPGHPGKWVPPWNVRVEVVDERGAPAPPGADGELVVTSLVNFAMPLVRYRIGDRGALAPDRFRGGQVLSRVLGRNVDAFRRRDGTLVDGEYFTHLLYFRDWVEKFQFVQTGYDDVVLRVVPRRPATGAPAGDLDELAAKTRLALGDAARLRVECVDEIAPAASGKYRYTISEVPRP